MTKQTQGVLFIVIASLLLSVVYIPPFDILINDKEVYRYIGMVMARGGVPYRDVFDHKPPLILFFNYIVVLLGGDWAQWVLDAGLAALATVLFFRVCRNHRLPFPWLLPLLFNLMLRDHLISLGIGMTREYSAMLLLIFFSILIAKPRHRYFLMGLVSGIIFFLQQDQMLALIPFFLYSFLPGEDPAPFGKRLIRIAAGFLVVALPIVGYFAVTRSLPFFWQDAFSFNLGWYTGTLKESPWDHWRKIKATLDQGNYELPAMVSMTLGISALFFRHRNKRLLFLSLVAVFLSISTEFMGGRALQPLIYAMSFTHYFLPLAASLPILLFVVFAFAEEPVLQGAKAQSVYGVLLCASLLYTDLQHAANRKPKNEDLLVRSPEMNYLRQHRPGDYQLYIWFNGDAIFAYNEFGILSPSRWIYQHFWQLYGTWDASHALLFSIEKELLMHHTKYILYYYKPSESFLDPSAYDLWRAFLQQHYEQVPVKDTQDVEVWKLKGMPE